VELDVRLVRSFVAVADERSFTRAADRLHVAQPWLSVQIRKLEDQLGFRLFERNRNQAVTASSKAEAFLPFAREYLVAVERVTDRAQRIRDEAAVTLRVGAPDFSVDMPIRSAILRAFSARHARFDIEVVNAWTVELLRRLRDGEIDVAFTLGPHVDPHSEAMVIKRYRLSLLVERERIAGIAQPVPLAALAGREVAIFRRNVNPAFYDSIAPILEAAGIIVDHLQEAGNLALVQQALRTRVPVLVGDWQEESSIFPDPLMVAALDEPALSFNLNLVRRIGDRTPQIAALWETALQMIEN